MEPWPGFDINERATLCRCCAVEILPSGSRWSVWFCDDCKQRVLGLNDAVGGVVIPIGRHTLMNRIGIRGTTIAGARDGGPETRREIDRFVDAVFMLQRQMERLDEWCALRTAHDVEHLGMAGLPSVPVARFLRAARAAAAGGDPSITKTAAFAGLVEHFRRPH
jgi:hypothetical protein